MPCEARIHPQQDKYFPEWCWDASCCQWQHTNTLLRLMMLTPFCLPLKELVRIHRAAGWAAALLHALWCQAQALVWCFTWL